MNILLIAPASGPWHQVGRHTWFNGKTFRFSLLSLLTVAAHTPPEYNVTLCDEQLDDIPWDADVDLVGITAMTAGAPRAYQLAQAFRARGVPVVLGGFHPTFRPDEALQHADAVVAGEAEGVWHRVLADARAGRLQGVYRAPALCELRNLPRPRRELLDAERYATVHAVQATRGCPNRCSFCAVTAFNDYHQRRRPVAEVIEEIRAIPANLFIFVDDHLLADADYARELLTALQPLGKRWAAQTTLEVADDPALLAALADAGCIAIFAGLETFAAQNLSAVDKRCNRVDTYRRAIRAFHRHGIAVEAGIVFGFDGDDPTVFRETLRQLDRLHLDAIQVSILTPLPGTAQYEALRNRLINHDWEAYDFHHAVFQPRQMSAAQLQSGHDWVTRSFYRPWRIARRLLRHAWRPRGLHTLRYLAAINLAYYGRTLRWQIHGHDPARRHTAAPRPRPAGVARRHA